MPIVSKKSDPVRAVFRWDPALVEEIDRIAVATGRSRNEAAELMMRWAVDQTRRELEMAEADSPKARSRK